MWQIGTGTDTANVYIRTSVLPISMVALTILHKCRQHSADCCDNLLWAGIHTFYFYVLQLILCVYSVCWKKVSTKFALKISPFITLLSTIFKTGARNVFQWLIDAPNKHVHCTCKFSRWNWRHYILNDLLLIVFSVRTVTVNFILWHASHIKMTWAVV